MLPSHSGIQPKQYKKHIDDISGGTKQDFLPEPTTTQSFTFKALQNTKITKLGLLSFSPLIFNRRSTTTNEKQIDYRRGGSRTS